MMTTLDLFLKLTIVVRQHMGIANVRAILEANLIQFTDQRIAFKLGRLLRNLVHLVEITVINSRVWNNRLTPS